MRCPERLSWGDKGVDELFNLKEDPFEKKDLSKSHPEKLQTIMTAMIKDLEAKKALYPQKDNKDLRPEMPALVSK